MRPRKIGDLIEPFDNRNTECCNFPFYGINKEKTFMPTVADTNNLDKSKYKIVCKNDFVFSGMQTGRDVCIRIALYDKTNPIIVSPAYTTFRVKNVDEAIPQYLFIQFDRMEMDRYGWFLSDGSIRSNLDWDRFCEIGIPLPSPEVQQELVDTYNGLKALAEQNEALIEPLSKACEAFIISCKIKYKTQRLGNYITEVDNRNTNLSIKLSQGISNMKHFQDPKQVAENSRNDKIVRKGQFAYNRATTRNGEKISIAYRDGEDCTVSSAYGVFYIKDEQILNPYFLMMWFKRNEFDRYARWRSEGSAHEFFTFEMMEEVKIPLPPIEVQQSIVNLYHCMEEAKKIASEAREKLKMLCPALVQKAANS